MAEKEEYQSLLEAYKQYVGYDKLTKGAQLQFWTDIRMCSNERIEYDIAGLKKWINTMHPKEVFDELVKKSKNKSKGSVKKEKKDEEEIIHTSLLVFDNKIAEQCYDEKTGVVFFFVYDSKKETIEKMYEIELNGIKHKPIRDEEVIKKAILLPNGTEEYGSDKELDKSIKDFIKKWLDVPKNVLQFALWNIKRSWVFERFHTLNYLRALGDTGMGKTRFLDALGYIHYKPIATSGAASAAAIFRIAEKWKGTLIIDEADFSKSDESQAIIKIINHGYEKGKFIMKCDKDDHNKVQFFDAYCPKILATRKTFEDKATESRCITHVMEGTERQDIPLNLNKFFWEESLLLRNKLLLWRFRNYFKINPNSETDFNLGDIEPRVKQIVSSFVNLFINDTEQLEEFKGFISDYQEELIDERKNTFEGVVVETIYNLINDGRTDFDAKEIIEEGHITNTKGVLIKPRSLSSTLKSLGFAKSGFKKISGKSKRCIPLKIEHLQRLFKRYGFDGHGGTVDTISNGTAQKGLKAYSASVCQKVDTPVSSGKNSKKNEGIPVTTVTTVPTVTEKVYDFIKKNPECSFFIAFTKLGIDEEKLDKILKELKKKGEIFEPRPDKFMIV